MDEMVARGDSLLLTSLTKAAAAEIASRKLPIDFQALGTLHSHCYHALGSPEIAEGREHLEVWNDEEPEYRLSVGAADAADAERKSVPRPTPRTCR